MRLYHYRNHRMAMHRLEKGCKKTSTKDLFSKRQECHPLKIYQKRQILQRISRHTISWISTDRCSLRFGMEGLAKNFTSSRYIGRGIIEEEIQHRCSGTFSSPLARRRGGWYRWSGFHLSCTAPGTASMVSQHHSRALDTGALGFSCGRQ